MNYLFSSNFDNEHERGWQISLIWAIARHIISEHVQFDTLTIFLHMYNCVVIMFVLSSYTFCFLYCTSSCLHDDVIKWKHFPRYWPFVRGIHRSPVNSPHKGQWRGALMFTSICFRKNGWVNNCEAGDLRRNRAHYDVIVMGYINSWMINGIHTLFGGSFHPLTPFDTTYMELYFELLFVFCYVYIP